MSDPVIKTLAQAIRDPAGTILEFLGEGPKANDVPYREGRKADHERGVLLTGPWERLADGFCEHTRRLARALADAGVPVKLQGTGYLPDDEIDPPARAAVEDLLALSIATPAVAVHSFVYSEEVVTARMRAKYPIPQEQLSKMRKAQVMSTVLERDRVNKKSAALLATCGQVWGACSATLQALQRSGVPQEMLRHVPVPFFPDDPHIALQGRARRPGPPIFYHVGKWEPRKDQHRMLLAFLRAFKPGEAQFYLRCNALVLPVAGYTRSPAESLFYIIKDPRVAGNGWTMELVSKDVFWINQVLPKEKLVALHGMCDVYVSMSHGEGFDMPAFDAKLSGNRLLFTDSGGPGDFAGPGDVLVPTGGTVHCHPMYGWETDAKWVDYWDDDAIESFRDAAKGLPETHTVAPHSLDRFSAAAVGEDMVRNLKEVVAVFDGSLT